MTHPSSPPPRQVFYRFFFIKLMFQNWYRRWQPLTRYSKANRICLRGWTKKTRIPLHKIPTLSKYTIGEAFIVFSRAPIHQEKNWVRRTRWRDIFRKQKWQKYSQKAAPPSYADEPENPLHQAFLHQPGTSGYGNETAMSHNRRV